METLKVLSKKELCMQLYTITCSSNPWPPQPTSMLECSKSQQVNGFFCTTKYYNNRSQMIRFSVVIHDTDIVTDSCARNCHVQFCRFLKIDPDSWFGLSSLDPCKCFLTSQGAPIRKWFHQISTTSIHEYKIFVPIVFPIRYGNHVTFYGRIITRWRCLDSLSSCLWNKLYTVKKHKTRTDPSLNTQ